MRDIIINLQKSGTCKAQLTIAIDFNLSKVVDEEHVIYSKSDNTEFMACDNINDVVDEYFESPSFKIPNWFRNINERDFILDSVQLLYCKCRKVNFKCGGLYIESPE